jgi:hypothetical protein
MRKSTIATGFALAIAALFAMNQSRAAEQIMSDGKCWTNTSDTNFGWADCRTAKRSSRQFTGPSTQGRPFTNGPGANRPGPSGGGGGGEDRGSGGGKM